MTPMTPLTPRKIEAIPSWAAEYLALLDDCEARESRLTDWQRGFVDSMRKQIEGGRQPTAKQVEALSDVWERATARG
jgi:hypothetical protein